MAATLADLVSDRLRSQLALGLEAYLQAFVDLTVWLEVAPPFVFLPDGVTQDAAALALYQLPHVVNLEDVDDEMNRRRQELDARGAFGRGEQASRSARWDIDRVAPAAPWSSVGRVRGRRC